MSRAGAIHSHFEVAKELGRVLHFVEDDWRRVARQEGLRLALGLLCLGREVQRDEPVP